jgi:hypothetical protein
VYNAVDEAQHKESKLEVLKQLIRFAAETRLAELIQPFLAGAAGWPAKWALSAEQAGSLFLLIAQCMERYGNAEEAQVFLIRYLTTLEGASAAMLAEARHWAKAAALNFVKAPAVSQKSNLARLAAVRGGPLTPPPPRRNFCLGAAKDASRNLYWGERACGEKVCYIVAPRVAARGFRGPAARGRRAPPSRRRSRPMRA